MLVLQVAPTCGRSRRIPAVFVGQFNRVFRKSFYNAGNVVPNGIVTGCAKGNIGLHINSCALHHSKSERHCNSPKTLLNCQKDESRKRAVSRNGDQRALPSVLVTSLFRFVVCNQSSFRKPAGGTYIRARQGTWGRHWYNGLSGTSGNLRGLLVQC